MSVPWKKLRKRFKNDPVVGGDSISVPATSQYMIKPHDFAVSFHQIGGREDVQDWIYSYVCHSILDSGMVVFKLNRASGVVKDVNKFIKEITELTDTFLRFVGVGGSKASSYVATNIAQTTYLCVDHEAKGKESHVSIWFCSSDVKSVEVVEKFCKSNFIKSKDNLIYVVSNSHGGLSLNSLGAADTILEKENYTEEIIKGYDYLLEEFGKSEPYGRLAIINGSPGTGKSYLIRSFLSQIKNCLIVLLPAKLVSEIDSPQLISLLAEEKSEFGRFYEDKTSSSPILFVVEDADACLIPREGDNIMTISSLLNYTDGILGSMLDLRVIATTNAEHIEFDKALTRPGRLCRHMYVGELSPERASKIYKRITDKEKEYKQPTTLAQVYADANGNFQTAQEEKKSLGFGE